MAANPPRSLTGVTPDILDKMDDYMDNMDNAVTNKKSFLDKLVATNANQASIISIKSTTIISLSDEFKKLQLRIINISNRGG